MFENYVKTEVIVFLVQIMTAREEELKSVWESRIEELVSCARA